MDKTELFLRELTQASGVSGYEANIRSVIRKHMEPLGKVFVDNLGSLICQVNGTVKEPRIMLAAHMDEIGFMVKSITEGGAIRFNTLGGWPGQSMLGHRVNIETGNGMVPGTIGGAPEHAMSEEERKKPADHRDMYIDIGATSKKDVEKAGVRIGDPIVPVSDFCILSVAQKTYMSKAFDDRIGCAAVITATNGLGSDHPNTIFGVTTVQEEVGVRGATTSAEAVNPDVAIILDVSTTQDTPGGQPDTPGGKIGAGPALINYDPRMIPNLKLRDMTIETAAKLKIPLQIYSMEFGGFDGSAIHLHRTGVPTVVIGLPCRHAHSHNSIISRADYDNAVKLTVALVKKLDKKTVASFIPK
jgi:putative aminopeptidase FrvX